MPNYEVELTESRTIMMTLKADSEEDARLQAEEEYYASHSIDETLADFCVKDVTKLDDFESEWEN